MTEAEPQDEDSLDWAAKGRGFKMLMKTALLQGGMRKTVGEPSANESQEDYFKRALRKQRPVVNSAIAWTWKAIKEVKSSFWQDPRSEPKRPTELSDFATGGQVAGSDSVGAHVLDSEGNEIKLEADSDEEPEEPVEKKVDEELGEEHRPLMLTAFSTEAWAAVETNQEQSTSEILTAVKENTDLDGVPLTASEADFECTGSPLVTAQYLDSAQFEDTQ